MKDEIKQILQKFLYLIDDINMDEEIDNIFKEKPSERNKAMKVTSDSFLALLQAQHEQDIKAFEEIIGEDGFEWPGASLEDEFKNDLRAELRTKLDQYKKEGGICKE